MSIKFDFKRGDIVWALGEIAVIVDVLFSEETENVCVYVRFVRNLGNARSYDMLELTPERTLGVEEWTRATQEDLAQALEKRKQTVDKEIQALIALVNTAQSLEVSG